MQLQRITETLSNLRSDSETPPNSMAGVKHKARKSKTVRRYVGQRTEEDEISNVEKELIRHHVTECCKMFGTIPLRAESKNFIRKHNIGFTGYAHLNKHLE